MDRPARHAPEAPFGARLRAAREAAGLTQEELAERAGSRPNAVGALERGEHRHPYPATVRALAAALGLTTDDARRPGGLGAPARPPLTQPASHAPLPCRSPR